MANGDGQTEDCRSTQPGTCPRRAERPGARHDVLDEPADNAGMTPEPHESTGAVVERPARRPPRSQLRRRQHHHAAIRAGERTVERFEILHFAAWTAKQE